jgi:hypothetical protein
MLAGINFQLFVRRFFYYFKPLISRRLQISARRIIVNRKRSRYADEWPIDERAKNSPPGWPGWPDGKRFAFVLMHDVDTQKGHDNCHRLMELEQNSQVRSSYFFVPRRYTVSPQLRQDLIDKGFEVGVHGFNHDGTLFSSWETFQKQAKEINKYISEWRALGFSSPSMHHNLLWTHELNVNYDVSTFDTDPFEPQPDGVGTIFPFIVKNAANSHSYVELPYTLPQDFTLFVIMREKNISLWKKKIDWVAQHGGMALVNSHPDYMHFGGGKIGPEEYPSEWFLEFIEYVKSKYAGQYWHVLPHQMSDFCAAHLK